MMNYKDTVLSEFEQLGIKDGEVYIRNTKSTILHYRNGEIEALKQEDELGASIRVLNDKKLGFSYTTSLLKDQFTSAIRRAYEFSKFAQVNPYYNILQENLPSKDVKIYDPEIPELSVGMLEDFAKRIERSAREYDNRIKAFRVISIQKGESIINLINSYGVEKGYKLTFIYFLVELIAEDENEREMGLEMALSPILYVIDPEEVGRTAASKAISALGGKVYKTGKYPVIFNPETVAELLGALAPAFSGENVMKGKSLYIEMLGQKIASSTVTLVNDGTIPSGVASSPFDDEGTPTRRVELISNGILNSYLHTLYSASYFGVESTGSGFRSSIKSLPSVSPANLHFSPGVKSPRDIIGIVNKGIYITSLIGAHTINPISGDFSVGITGHLIENGEITFPVKGMTLAGNIKDFLNRIVEIGNDLRFFPRGVGGSTILVEDLSIGGK